MMADSAGNRQFSFISRQAEMVFALRAFKIEGCFPIFNLERLITEEFLDSLCILLKELSHSKNAALELSLLRAALYNVFRKTAPERVYDQRNRKNDCVREKHKYPCYGNQKYRKRIDSIAPVKNLLDQANHSFLLIFYHSNNKMQIRGKLLDLY